MCAQAYESGLPMTMENVRRFSPYHPRCGTALISLLAILIPISFSFIPIGGVLSVLFKTGDTRALDFG